MDKFYYIIAINGYVDYLQDLTIRGLGEDTHIGVAKTKNRFIAARFFNFKQAKNVKELINGRIVKVPYVEK